jgi:prepilin-type N-terminal cleavage/methylation domain-containing protein
MKTHNMKKGFTLVELLIFVVIIGCLLAIIIPAINKNMTSNRIHTQGYSHDDIRVVRIDGCEYLESGVANGFTRTHKGNCDNPIHYQNHSNVNPER